MLLRVIEIQTALHPSLPVSANSKCPVTKVN